MEVYGPPRRWVKVCVTGMLLVGVAGSVYQAGLLRLYLPVQDHLGRQNQAGLAERTMALREALHDLEVLSPKNAVLQYDTHQPSEYFNYAQLLNTPRQLVNALPECVVAFGGAPAPCAGIKKELAQLFMEPDPAEITAIAAPANSPRAKVDAAADANAVCKRLGIEELVATRWDPIWGEKSGWVWSLPVVASTARVRVVKCGTTTS